MYSAHRCSLISLASVLVLAITVNNVLIMSENIISVLFFKTLPATANFGHSVVQCHPNPAVKNSHVAFYVGDRMRKVRQLESTEGRRIIFKVVFGRKWEL